MSSSSPAPAPAPAPLNAAQQRFVEETCLMEQRHVEALECIAKFGFTFFCMVALFLVTGWSMNLLNDQRTTQQVFLTGYTLVGFPSFLIAKKTPVHRRGMGFKILVVVGVWMWLTSVLSPLTLDHQWPGFQLIILAVTAIMVVLPAVFTHKFHRQQMEARMHKISQMLKRR